MAVHILNGVLIYVVAAALLEPCGAALAALLFLLSPLQVESVAYVSGRTELLSALAILIACALAVQWPKPWHAIAIPAVLVAGLLAKETAIVGFVLVPLLAVSVWPDLWRDVRRHRGVLLLVGLLACVGAAAVLWPLRHLAEGTVGSERGGIGFVAIQAAATWRYLFAVIVPWGLTIDHDYDLIPHVVGYLAIGGIVGLIALAWITRRTAIGFGLAWMLIALAPRFLVRIPEFLNEHQMYVPMIGIAIVGGALADLAIGIYQEIAPVFASPHSHEPHA